MMSVKIQHLTKAYPNFLLNDISFQLEEGTIMGLIGKNGAGKSTIIKSMIHMINPDKGALIFWGQDIMENEQEIKANLGIAIGGMDIYRMKTIKQIYTVTKRFYPKWDEKAFQRYLKLFSLEENKKMNQLSEGMKVKFFLALALSHHAKLLILDEPTSGLDPLARDELLQLFKEIVADGKTSILFSTHITSDLDKCADAITYIHEGNVICSDTKEHFFQHFDYLETKRPVTIEEIMLHIEGRIQ